MRPLPLTLGQDDDDDDDYHARDECDNDHIDYDDINIYYDEVCVCL